MYFLVEKDAEGNAVNRYNLDTDTSLTKAVLIQILKAAHDNPDRYEVIVDKDAPPHPSDGIEPKDHKDALELINDYQKEIEATGYTLDSSDFHRLATVLSDAFQARYGVKPRSINRPSPHNPKVWSSRKLAYPPSFFEAAKVVIVAYCQERVDMITQAGLDLKKRFKRKKPFRPGISEYTD